MAVMPPYGEKKMPLMKKDTRKMVYAGVGSFLAGLGAVLWACFKGYLHSTSGQ